MKVILYMAMSVDGLIAKLDDSTPWSDIEWQAYKKAVKKYGNLIVGRKTYEIMRADNTLGDLGNPIVVVVSNAMPTLSSPNTYFVTSCNEAISLLKEHGHKTALIGGGTQLNTSFLQAKMVDEIIIDLEPIILGQGIPLFQTEDFELNLKLLGFKKLSTNTIQLHYSVLK